jgi:ABC-type glycerol-3-phosphate transport system permease component
MGRPGRPTGAILVTINVWGDYLWPVHLLTRTAAERDRQRPDPQ